MKWLNAVLPVLTLILGYLGTIITENRQHARALRLGREERAATLQATHAAERRAFELTTLTQTQSAAARYARAVGRAHFLDVMAARASGTDRYLTSPLPEDANQELFDSNSNLARLEGLIMDEETRLAVSSFRSEAGRLSGLNGVTVSEADAVLLGAVDWLEGAQPLIAQQIRGLYEEPVTTP